MGGYYSVGGVTIVARPRIKLDRREGLSGCLGFVNYARPSMKIMGHASPLICNFSGFV
jgi:hypothetical protein